MVTILKQLLRVYHWLVSPWLGPRCRYVPSCSDYAQQALDQHGLLKGSSLALQRLLRCHPWGGEGLDPVPDRNGVRCFHSAPDNNVGLSQNDR